MRGMQPRRNARPESPPAHRIGSHLPPSRDDADADSVRWELVERIRAEIAAGTYDTTEKWQVALQKCADDVLGD